MTENYYSRVNYTYQGGSKIFTVPFNYIDISYVKVFINDELITSWSSLSESQLQLDNSVELNAGDIVTIMRQTPVNERMVVFSDTSILNESTQNLAQEQMFDVVQEVHDSLNSHKADVETLKPYVKEVVENIEDIIIANENISDINTVADNITNINSVSSNLTDIDKVADNITGVNAAANSISNVNTVSNNIDDVNTVANNIGAINDFAIEKDMVIQSKGIKTGSVSEDADTLADVQSYVHSTFDVSKFTVVGTPTISDNGIASGFSSSNYLKTITLDTSKTFEIIVPITTGNDVTTQNTLMSIEGAGRLFAFDIKSSYLKLYASSDGESWNLDDVPVKSGIATNTTYILKITSSTNLFRISEYSNNNWNTLYNNTSFTLHAETGRYLILGVERSHNVPFLGSYDLKQFSITVDGVEVFSGNKTGIDTIKPDDYTVVGTPTISADGVALTGYGRTDNSNKFSSNQFDVLSNNQQFECMAYIEPLPSDYAYPNQGQNVCSFDQGNNYIRIQRADLTTLNTIRLEQFVNGSWAGNSGSTGWGLGTSFAGWTKFKIYYDTDDTCYKCDCYTINDGVETFVKTMVCNYTGSATTGTDWIFKNEYGQYQNYGKIDLNSIKVYDNNNLVYQPCLKIPYTESKTGSKVVNSIYRDRVFDMYEQFGYAPYYTLSDSDFTLPMGEVYGMIERKADASLLTGKADKDLNNVPASKGILTESYVNGTSWYRVYSDKFCVQGGLAMTTSSVSSITLLKEYADTNYTIIATSRHDTSTAGGVAGISSYDISATGFKLFINQDSGSHPRSWVTYGYIA